MCYYIGIDDLAANALIELLKKDGNRRFVSYDSLKEYGANVLKTLQDDGEEAILIYTRDSKAAFLRDYSDFFREDENDGKVGLYLLDEIKRRDLIKCFRGYLPYKVVLAFMDDEAVNELVRAA